MKLKKKGKSSTSQEERAVSARGREIDFLCSSERPRIPPNVVVFFVVVFFCPIIYPLGVIYYNDNFIEL